MERNLLDIPLGDSTQHTTRSSHKYESVVTNYTLYKIIGNGFFPTTVKK